jgi:Leucine-rich repeat (LRR) protein
MNKIQIKKCFPYNQRNMGHSFHLRLLFFADCQIKDISLFGNFISVSRMYLVSNRIVDLTPLKNLVNLKELNLSVNPISQQQIDELKKALPNCHISFDYDI